MEVIGEFDRNYFDEVMRLRAVWNGFQKEWEEVDRRQALGSSLEEFPLKRKRNRVVAGGQCRTRKVLKCF